MIPPMTDAKTAVEALRKRAKALRHLADHGYAYDSIRADGSHSNPNAEQNRQDALLMERVLARLSPAPAAEQPGSAEPSFDEELRLREIEAAARIIFVTFQKSEEQGYRSRERQYVIDMFKPYFAPMSSSAEPVAPAEAAPDAGLLLQEELQWEVADIIRRGAYDSNKTNIEIAGEIFAAILPPIRDAARAEAFEECAQFVEHSLEPPWRIAAAIRERGAK